MSQFSYSIPARVTLYNKTEYRSELEASWAAFFDIRGLTDYEYEPATTFGHIWRPDFSVELKDGGFVFSEVKPFSSENQWKTERKTLAKITKALQEICPQVAVLLGSSPVLPSSFMFRIKPAVDGPEEPEFEELIFGALDDVKNDWKEARNIVRWRPNGN